MPDTLTISIDHEQPRLKHDALGFVVVGATDENRLTDRPTDAWSDFYRSQTSNEDDTWLDPITNTLMLMPLPLLNAWGTTGSGAFSRLALVDLNIITTANWVLSNVNGSSSAYVHGFNSTVSEAISTTTIHAVNRAIYFSAKVEAPDSEERAFLSVGWDKANRNTATAVQSARPVYFNFFTTGKVEVWFNNELVQTDSISSPGQKTSAGLWGDWTKVLLIPIKTGILVYCANGGGFFWERPDIEPDDVDPVITPNADMWWQSYGGATVEFAPLKFRTSGYRCSVPAHWTVPPQVGAVAAHLFFGDYLTGVTGSFVDSNNTGPFVPDGVTKECRVKVALSGDGNSTPFVFAGHSAYSNELTTTDGSEEKDVTPYVTAASFDVPECKGETSFEFTLSHLRELDEEIGPVPHLETMTMRPVIARIGTTAFFDGMIAERPRIRRGSTLNVDQMQVKCEGLYRLMKRFRFKDPVPLDGATCKEALEYIAIRSGIPVDRLDIEEFGISVGQFTRCSKGEFHLVVQVGDDAASVWDRIFDEYLPDCHWTEKPTPSGTKIVAFSPDNMPALTTPYRIFDTHDAAIAHLGGLGYTGEELERLSYSRVFRTLDEEGFEPEANAVYVQGKDRRLMRPIVWYQQWPEGTAFPQSGLPPAIDPEVPPSLRTAQWSGDENIYGLINDAFATDAQCQDACGRLYKRLAYGRDLREIEIDLMIDPDTLLPLWTGNEIEIQQNRDGEEVVSRWTIVRFGGEFVKEFPGNILDRPPGGGAIVSRPCRYVLERIQEEIVTTNGLGHNVPGRSLAEMRAFMALRQARNYYGRPKNLAPRISAVEFGA